MKIKILIILLIFIFIFLNYFQKKNNYNEKILPFGYQLSNEIVCSDKQNFYKLLNKYGTQRDIDITNRILKINHNYAPTWGIKIKKEGIKIKKQNIIEFEMYFYVYNPENRNFEPNCITLDKLEKEFEIKKTNNKNPITMYSIDYDEDIITPNYYYFTSTNDKVDIGYSEKDNNLNNHYYRYFPHTIDEKYKKYIDTNIINKKIKNIKTVFIADKLIRNYIGIYYDGITYQQLRYFINKYNFDNDIIKDLNTDQYYSVSVDYNKENDNIEKIGIYGLLY
jgi:hypothetical protein